MRARLWALLGRLIPDDLFDVPWADDETEYCLRGCGRVIPCRHCPDD